MSINIKYFKQRRKPTLHKKMRKSCGFDSKQHSFLILNVKENK